ncbi:hypothetical protein EOT10_36030 [Streptomyces antnestii]|uniref:Lipoprotein CseA n=1 Tax=Streptomyces antnestii TaxID=2494256 RepID=A0A437P3D9_9ACTN|nr:hypothetical protein [Streptomyces sp. San01]RVU16773.1 hypothetical protein EOT10_36030 [Streptomyces sp. San01]
MRGLGIRAGRVLRAGSTAVAALAAVGLFLGVLTACSAGGTGARDEGPARTDPVGSAAPKAESSASSTPAPKKVNAVRLVKDDPAVSPEVKRDLKPCVGKEYPVDVSYGNLTGNTTNDVVVNVMTCGDAVSIGSYVYRDEGGRYTNVFKAEEPPVYAEIDRGDLVVTKQVYEKGDSVSYPSGEDVLTYRWTSGRFAEKARTHSDYSNAVNGGTPAPSDN